MPPGILKNYSALCIIYIGISLYLFPGDALHAQTLQPQLAVRNLTLSTSKRLIIPEPGESFVFGGIRFKGNSPSFLPSAKPSLDSLLDIMKRNPTLKIEIHGHVNGPHLSNTIFFKELAEERAKAVFDFLVMNRIASNRMAHHGYGNTRMLFPDASNSFEMEQNRRVEIKVISK